MLNLILISLFFPSLALIFESYPRFLNRKFGVDIWTHLLYLKEYHRRGGIPKTIGKNQGFIIEGEYDYPPAFIWILSKFPFKLVKEYEFLFSPLFDFLHLVFVFFISYFITQNIAISLITQVLYMLTPIIILENSSATPRSLGYLLFTLVFSSLFYFELTSDIKFFAFSVFFGSLIFLSHRFTTQSFLFFSVFFTVNYQNISYLLSFALSFLSAIVISRGFYIKVLKGHIGNLRFWQKNIAYRFAHQVRGNCKEHKTEDLIFRLYNQFLKFPPFVLAITNPWILPVIFMFFFYFPSEMILQKMIIWVLFSYLLALMTIWFPPLRFLGEGQRYLELSAFPSAFASALLLFKFLNTDYKWTALIIYSLTAVSALITIIVIQRKAIIKDKMRTLTPPLAKMFAYLKNLKKKPKLLCIPHQITTSTIYHTGCLVFVNAGYANIVKISEVYPYLRIPILRVMEKYSLDAILLNEEYAKVDELRLKKYKIVKKVKNFLLIRPL